MAHFPRLSALLPLDVLRLIFEFAVCQANCQGASLATVSKRVQRWVEPVLYSVVNLQRPRTKLLFLRTIQTSKTKSAAFFATHVKTLCIAHDPSSYDDCTARVISACRGLNTLTFTSISVMKQRTEADSSRIQWPTGIVGDTDGTFPLFHSTLLLDRFSHSGNFTNDQTTLNLRRRNAIKLKVALAALRPQHVTTLLPISGPEADIPHQAEDKDGRRSALPISVNIHWLSNTTHLSIQNPWENWISWAGHFEFARLPCLTHLSLDLRAAFSVPRSKATCADQAAIPDMTSQEAERACVLARATQCILSQSPQLRVCVLRLIFDSNPDRTAAAILAQMPLSRRILPGRDATQFRRQEGEAESDGGDEERVVRTVDPRLVFLWDKEPFQHREAHSKKVIWMWDNAEGAVKRQSTGLGQFRIL